ncbi:MAG TPA: hypothetical protein VK968_06915 [Roseimicrobium sp.]|nr:hypothetical protein [Roseimicrobium sp.]
MKPFLTLALFFGLSAASTVLAEDAKPLLHDKPLPAVAAPTFKEPLDSKWSVAKGKWTPADGVLDVVEIPEDKHVPVLHHKAGLQSAVIECDFRFDGPGSFLIGCDGAKHVGRVVVSQTALSIAEDSVAPSHTIAKLDMPVKQGEWHHIRVEWKGDEMAARLDGKELRAKHEYLAKAKAQSWLAVAKAAKVRNLTINGQ